MCLLEMPFDNLNLHSLRVVAGMCAQESLDVCFQFIIIVMAMQKAHPQDSRKWP